MAEKIKQYSPVFKEELTDLLKQNLQVVLISFETGEQGNNFIYFPFAAKITALKAVVVPEQLLLKITLGQL